MRSAILAVLWLCVSGSVLAVPACYGHACEADTVEFGRTAGEGRLASPDIWESNANDGQWLDFPHERTYQIDLHELGVDRVPVLVIPYVSAQANPLAEGGNSTIAAGNLTVITVDRGHVSLRNDTCANYYLRVVVQASPLPPASDAGSPSP